MKTFTFFRRTAGGSRLSVVAMLFVVAVLGGLAAVVPAYAQLPAIGVGLATLAANNPTLLDLAKALDPDGVVADIVEILNETNAVLDDMTFVEGNLITGHRSVIRTGIPLPTWRRMYGGVQPNKSTNVQVTDTTGMLEAYGQVDKALADLNGNTMAFRASEDRPHLEGVAQTIASTTFYGNETTLPESFTGLAPRYSTVQVANAESADNVIDGGGVGSNNASIWLVCWGPRTVHGIIPKGSKAGMQATDLGEQMIQNSDGSKYQAYVTHYRQDAGLTVRDWRFAGRVCNIDVPSITGVANLANTKALITFMIMLEERIPNLGVGRPVWYMNRQVRESLRLAIIEKIAPATLTAETVAGKPVIMFDGIPVKRVDQLLKTEARVT
jgi:hypothetical protein